MRYEKFSLQPETACPWLFTVFQDKTRTLKKTGETYEDLEAIAYGVQFDRALDMIATLAADRTSIQKHIEDYGRIRQLLKEKGD